MQALELESLRERRVGELSKGNLQRLAIAQALLYDRRLMILDEPTDGLDPFWMAELRSLIALWREGEPERVLLIASHDLGFIERVVDRVLVLHGGRLLADRPLEHDGPPLEEAFLHLVRDGAPAA